MPKKYYFQIGQDVVLTILLLSLTGYHLFEEVTHEWVGLGFFALVLLHIGLNFWWIKKLNQGEFDVYRMVKTGLNFVLFFVFLTACISGILLSKHIFAEFPFHLTDDFTRKIHMLSTHWIQTIIAIHLGLHWKTLADFLAQILRWDLNKPLTKWILPTIWTMLSVYGLWAFIGRDLFPYLMNQVDFAFFDKAESKAIFYFDYFAMLILFAYSTRVLVWLIFFKNEKK
ncbi:DUF4405 domain-containing protein [Basfia succiniciproducens]|uniref:Flavinylation-associated cytochrome domain-containing protein n=1 Tax=Basfia succiniciproducens TaxID=653940 RepID=A0A1G5AEN6_9PAST|nr:DUF4405 domain-containing protein [Basfia succiniciproducens]QIM68559.1 hypothetical protein A4G13_03725 [Basfia succiniciproducens]SCX76334.1 protein of unknown function [Basfia succiniciproducens]